MINPFVVFAPVLVVLLPAILTVIALPFLGIYYIYKYIFIDTHNVKDYPSWIKRNYTGKWYTPEEIKQIIEKNDK